MIPRDRLFADLAHALAALAHESIGGAMSVRLETREAEAEWRGQGSPYANGFGGWLVGGALTVIAGIVLGVAGIDLPAWWTDTFHGHSSDTGVGESMLLSFAFISAGLAAMAAAALVMWLADRMRARYRPASIIAEVTAAAVTIVCVVALGLAGDSWRLVPASMVIGSFAILFLYLLARGLRRLAAHH
jgi:hypothetical protein